MEQWDDVRFFLAIARQSSLSGAARTLRVDHATVGRRLTALEQRLGAKLFNRTLVTHPDLRRAAKIRVVSNAIADEFDRNATVLRSGRLRKR